MEAQCQVFPETLESGQFLRSNVAVDCCATSASLVPFEVESMALRSDMLDRFLWTLPENDIYRQVMAAGSRVDSRAILLNVVDAG